MGLTFADLYDTAGLGLIVGDTASASVANRKRVLNDAYIKHGTGRFWWNKRSHTYSASSSPALATANNSTMNVPTASGSAFDRAYRLGYRDSGRWVEVELVEDDEWLTRSATRTADAGDPEYARLVQTSSAVQLELNRPISQAFIDRVSSMTFEYFIVPARMTSDTEEPILPDSLRPALITLAAYDWAMIQEDLNLLSALTKAPSPQLRSPVEEALASFRQHDLTRTGKSRTIRPKDNYWPDSIRQGTGDYGMNTY